MRIIITTIFHSFHKINNKSKIKKSISKKDKQIKNVKQLIIV